jgi:hypothetical protein
MYRFVNKNFVVLWSWQPSYPADAAPECLAQTTSVHYLPLWGMKPTVLEQRNLLDLHTLILAHSGFFTRRHAALGAGQADIS